MACAYRGCNPRLASVAGDGTVFCHIATRYTRGAAWTLALRVCSHMLQAGCIDGKICCHDLSRLFLLASKRQVAVQSITWC